MKLLNVARARSIWLFDINDLNPRGKSVISDLLDWAKEAYGFSRSPSSSDDLEPDTKALAFLRGAFQLHPEFFIDVDLRIYNDGFVADTHSSTDDTDLFLKDVLETVAKEFDLTFTEKTVRRILYLSELNVSCDRPLSCLNPRLDGIGDKLSRLSRSAHPAPSFSLASIAFWSDPFVPTAEVFKLERKHGTSHSDNRYYSAAPMKTGDHVELLSEIEAALSA